MVYHARKLHVVILGADLDVMGHIHPEGARSHLACVLASDHRGKKATFHWDVLDEANPDFCQP